MVLMLFWLWWFFLLCVCTAWLHHYSRHLEQQHLLGLEAMLAVHVWIQHLHLKGKFPWYGRSIFFFPFVSLPSYFCRSELPVTSTSVHQIVSLLLLLHIRISDWTCMHPPHTWLLTLGILDPNFSFFCPYEEVCCNFLFWTILKIWFPPGCWWGSSAASEEAFEKRSNNQGQFSPSATFLVYYLFVVLWL